MQGRQWLEERKLDLGALEVGSWKLEVGSWKLEVGSWKLEVGSIFFRALLTVQLNRKKINPSTLQPFNPSTLQPFNPSTNQPINQSTLQPFTRYRTKTPPFFL
jgi:hypothetical protein